jgi:hypothetical protein
VHIFTDDAQHYALGASQTFDDVIGTVFLQEDDGSFCGIVSVPSARLTPIPSRRRIRTSPEDQGTKRGLRSSEAL